jgi:hypothetical protein
VKNFKTKFLNQEGQAVFELLIFLPFLLFLYTIYYTAGNAINGSINQQKAVRGYFYTLVKGNSYLSTSLDLKDNKDHNILLVGFNAIGWRDHSPDQKNSIAPCFTFSSLLKSNTSEKCEGDERDEEGSSRYIRLFTFYGVCGPTYTLGKDGSFTIEPNAQGIGGNGSCILGGN